MASQVRTVDAKCLCGAANHKLNLRAEDFPLKGTMALTVGFLPDHLEPEPSIVKDLTSYVFSKRITHYFCSTCSCQMLARVLTDGNDPGSRVFWAVSTGAFERIEGVIDWQGHEHVQDTLDGGFADFFAEFNGRKVARWPGHFGIGEELPIPWNSPDRSRSSPSAKDKLHGRCKCEGVEFWVARPSARSALAGKYWPEAPPADVSDQQPPPEEETWYLRDNRTKFLAGLCGCDSCRLASGMEITTWAFVSTMDITLDKEGKVPWSDSFGTLKHYESSPGAHRYFCGQCGAIVMYEASNRMWFKDIALGLLDSPEGVKAESWFGWRTSRVGFRDDAIPRAETFVLGIEKGLREWEERREGKDLSGGSQSGGAL